MKIKIGIFGGSFNPPHVGHLLVCQYALSIYDLHEVWMVPAQEHPFGKKLVDFWHRYEMCCKLRSKSSDRVNIFNFNEKHTVDLLENLVIKYPYYEFALIIGSDIELSEWKEPERIRELAEIITIYRHGDQESDKEALHFGRVKFPNISSTEIRKRLRKGLDVSGFVPKNVLEYIKSANLEF
jgi:nicotinate-nucleotide adenylyltransferase